MLRIAAVLAAAAVTLIGPAALVHAQQAIAISMTVNDNQFEPDEVQPPADTQIKFTVKNLDPKPMEFESKDLKFEKIVSGGSQITLTVRGQKPGRYEFYDDFHEDTTKGFLVVK